MKQEDLTRLLQMAGLLSRDCKTPGALREDAVVHVLNDDIAVVENIDVFTPIHDDPVVQGKIVACNATNDVFAMGVTDILSLQAFMAFPPDMDESIAVGVLAGMDEFMQALASRVAGGQTIKNPCPVFGGVCLGVARPDEIVYSSGAQPGDVVLLTKPLGIQPAMRSYRELKDERRDALLERFAESELLRMQDTAVRVMTTSNLEVARTMRAVPTHAATDVTGFGLLGHAENVATLSGVEVVIERVPVIPGTPALAAFFGHRLAEGRAAETAGGMLVFLPPDGAEEFRALLMSRGLPCWTVGRVVRPVTVPRARLARGAEFIETEFP